MIPQPFLCGKYHNNEFFLYMFNELIYVRYQKYSWGGYFVNYLNVVCDKNGF
jgi:hypothetical protein